MVAAKANSKCNW